MLIDYYIERARRRRAGARFLEVIALCRFIKLSWHRVQLRA